MVREPKEWTPADQEARVARAMREGFTFKQLADGEWICFSESGGSYLVRQASCSCEDFTHRASAAGGYCKHIIALRHSLLAEGMLPVVPAPEPKYRLVHFRSSGPRVMKSGLTRAEALRLKELASWDSRLCLHDIRVEEER